MQENSIIARYAAPIMAKRQEQNALMSMMQPQNGNALMDVFQQAMQYNAMQQHGGPTNAAAASLPQGGAATRLTQKLIERGMPEHVAKAFVVNFKDESGLKAGINEANPIVPGSRGGYGLYQLTGPRRREYEAYASQNGHALDSEDAQLDFLMRELQTTERTAGKSILSAPNTATAAQAIVNKFLRPAPEHRQSRSARYSRL